MAVSSGIAAGSDVGAFALLSPLLSGGRAGTIGGASETVGVEVASACGELACPEFIEWVESVDEVAGSCGCEVGRLVGLRRSERALY